MLTDYELQLLAQGMATWERTNPGALKVLKKLLGLLDAKKSAEEQKREAATAKVLQAMAKAKAAKDALEAFYAERRERAAGGAIVPFDMHGLVKHRNALAEAEQALKWARSEAAAQGFRVTKTPT